ncbi:MAG: type II toxin-antitoxin system HicB family antitoxin [Acidimicrobiia bacterium]
MARNKSAASNYRVDVVRSGNWWTIEIPDLPGAFSQARRLDQVEDMAREVIALMTDVDESDIDSLDVHVEPPADVGELLSALEDSVAAARDARATEAEIRRTVALKLREAGLPTRDVGSLIGVSHQRVSQILAS